MHMLLYMCYCEELLPCTLYYESHIVIIGKTWGGYLVFAKKWIQIWLVTSLTSHLSVSQRSFHSSENSVLSNNAEIQ